MTDPRRGERLPSFRRNERLEALLARLNQEISGGVRDESPTQAPILFLVGCPRSGATLLMQWLASSGAFAYPTNFIARFWSNPCVGALVQAMLTEPDFDFRGELADFRPAAVDFSSDLGKTVGFLAPNEFWYFWRRFFPFEETHCLTPGQLRQIDAARLEADLGALAAVSGKPLALKAQLADWHLDFLASSVRGSRFLYLERDPFFLMQSLLEARRRFFGTVESWYSLRPPELPALAKLSPYEQVAGQLTSIQKAVGRQLRALPQDRWLRITYEELCAGPGDVAERIDTLFPDHHLRWDGRALASRFVTSNTERLTRPEARRLRAAYRRFKAEGLPT